MFEGPPRQPPVPNSDLLELFDIVRDSEIPRSTIEAAFARNQGDLEQTFLDLSRRPVGEFSLVTVVPPPTGKPTKRGHNTVPLIDDPTLDHFDPFPGFQRNLAMRQGSLDRGGRYLLRTMQITDLDRVGVFQTLMMWFYLLIEGEKYKVKITADKDPVIQELVDQFFREMAGVQNVVWRDFPMNQRPGVQCEIEIPKYHPLANRKKLGEAR
jgi:hypothetical protein